MDIGQILSKLPAEALASLNEEERNYIKKQSCDLSNLIQDDMSLEDANTVGLRVFSLLSGVEAGEEEDMSTELQAMSLLSQKELINLFKKLSRLDCYKLRKAKVAKKETTPKVEVNPLADL